MQCGDLETQGDLGILNLAEPQANPRRSKPNCNPKPNPDQVCRRATEVMDWLRGYDADGDGRPRLSEFAALVAHVLDPHPQPLTLTPHP